MKWFIDSSGRWHNSHYFKTIVVDKSEEGWRICVSLVEGGIAFLRIGLKSEEEVDEELSDIISALEEVP